MTPLQDQMIEHIPALRRFARSLVRNRTAADDLVQATLERAIRKMHLYQPTGPFLGWLNTIMRNIFIDGTRRQFSALEPLDETAWNEPSVKETQVDRIFLHDLDGALAGLPREQRQVLMMVAVEGATYEAAAKRLRVPLGTIRSRLYRARLNLQRQIDPKRELALVHDREPPPAKRER